MIRATIEARDDLPTDNRNEMVMRGFGVQTVYHAAAYKHVPLVEHNPIEGLRNNAVGTRRMAVRLQGDYPDAYRTLIGLGARVRWTDLRMSAHGWTEVAPSEGMVLSNWEI